MLKRELINLMKDVLVETEVFSSDVEEWLEGAAKDVLKSLQSKGFQIVKVSKNDHTFTEKLERVIAQDASPSTPMEDLELKEIAEFLYSSYKRRKELERRGIK